LYKTLSQPDISERTDTLILLQSRVKLTNCKVLRAIR